MDALLLYFHDIKSVRKLIWQYFLASVYTHINGFLNSLITTTPQYEIHVCDVISKKGTLSCKIKILIKSLHLIAHYSTILFRKSMKSIIYEELLLTFLDTKFH